MAGFISQAKRIFKIKWKQTGTSSKDKMTIEQDIQIKVKTPGSRFDNGREFTEQENVQYILPKDVQELDRLHQQHWMLKVAFQGNFEAPLEEELEKGITVLDSGCRPGTWTLEMAEAFPNSKFHGIDVAPVFPQQIKPANCEFQLGNLNEKLPYPDNYFDFVHQRLLAGGLTPEGWENAMSELFRVLKPGGWIELKEIHDTLENMGPQGTKIIHIGQQFLRKRGLLPDVASELGPLLIKKGYEDVNVTKLGIPLNHGGLLGSLYWSDTKEVIRALRTVYAAADPQTFGDDNFEKALESAGAEFAEYETVNYWFDAYGRKPLA